MNATTAENLGTEPLNAQNRKWKKAQQKAKVRKVEAKEAKAARELGCWDLATHVVDITWPKKKVGEFFQSNDPKNPIGERWIGLKGMEPHNKNFEGYGIHGTTDLDSIGQQRSMGRVRMRPMDVEMVYELITEPNSTITIAP